MNCPHPYLTYLLPRRRQKSTQNYQTRLRLKDQLCASICKISTTKTPHHKINEFSNLLSFS